MIRSLSAFVRTRWLAGGLKTRSGVTAWQQKRLKHLLTKILPSFPFYRQYESSTLADLPVIDKAVLMSRFLDFNSAGVTAEAGWAIFEGRAPQIPGLSVGASTGTSGNRGLYVVSDAERREWLGVMLAKTLPRFPFQTAKVALVLPLNSALYQVAADTARLKLRFFDLNEGLEVILPKVEAYGPDTVIAPPKVLRALAEDRPALNLKRIFSGAEVLDPLDRAVIEDYFAVPVREIYMATEGLLGVACEYGTLHLSEDVVHFEFEPVGGGLVTPIITDFTRSVQAMCRYRMNDLLRLSGKPCRCGSPLQAVSEIVGRCDDLLVIGGHSLTPDILRNAIVDADRRIQDFRLRQTGAAALELILSDKVPAETLEYAAAALARLLDKLGVSAEIVARQEPLITAAHKLRRVENAWRG